MVCLWTFSVECIFSAYLSFFKQNYFLLLSLKLSHISQIIHAEMLEISVEVKLQKKGQPGDAQTDKSMGHTVAETVSC